MIRAYASSMTTDFGMCFARLDDRELGKEPRAQVRRSKRRYDLAFRKQIERGVEDGSVKPCNRQIGRFRDRRCAERDRGLVQAERRPLG